MYPGYLNLSEKELQLRIEKLFGMAKNCEICPRRCHINRFKSKNGYCKLGILPQVSAFYPHFGEESVLVGPPSNFGGGSGTIFFTSCNLACVYCQNYDISQVRIGNEISFERLAEMMLKLQDMGCYNINLVSPTSHILAIAKALSMAITNGLQLPLVYNTNSYDSVQTLKLLNGIIDIYMPDAKYSDNKLALKYSDAPGYFEIMKKAIKEIHRQVGDLKLQIEDGKLKIDEKGTKGLAIKGVLLRYLVLPNNVAGSEKIFEFLAKEISKNTFLNIMDQYWPAFKAHQFPELARRITQKEHQQAVQLAQQAGLKRLY